MVLTEGVSRQAFPVSDAAKGLGAAGNTADLS